MVGRLHVVLLSIVPTGAALVCLLWMFGWKKTKGRRVHHLQKTQVVGVTCEQSHASDETTVPSSSGQCSLSVNSEEDSPAENDVSSVMFASDDVSHGSSYTDVKSPVANESVSANTIAYEQSSESPVDMRSNGLDHDTADKIDTGHGDKADNIANEDEMLKCPVIECQENNTVAFLEDESCYNNCISDGDMDGNKAPSDSGCVVNNVPSERCENGRRDSMGSVRMFVCCGLIIIILFNCTCKADYC